MFVGSIRARANLSNTKCSHQRRLSKITGAVMSLFSLDWFWYRAMDLNERTRSGSRRPCGPGDVKPTPIRKEGEMVVLINLFLFCLWVWNWGCIRQTSWSDFDGVLGQEKRSYPSPDWIKNIPRLMLGVMALGLYPYPTQITLTHFTGCNHSNKHFNLKINCIRSLHWQIITIWRVIIALCFVHAGS